MAVDPTVIAVAAIGATGTLLVALVNTFGIRKSRITAGVAAEQLDTGNEKNLGHTVHDIAQTVELIAAQTHTNTSELLNISGKLDRHLEETSAMIPFVRDPMKPAKKPKK